MLVELEDVRSSKTASKINSNFQRIQQFINKYCVKRDNEDEEPNEMWTDLIFGDVIYGDFAANPGAGGGVCTTVADIVFLIDNTGSQLKATYTSDAIPAMSNMIQELINTGNDLRVGMMRIRQDVMDIEVPLSADLTLTKDAIDALPTPGNNTNLAVPLLAAKAELDANGRAGVPGIVVIITDGIPNIKSDPYGVIDDQAAIREGREAATVVKDAGYRIVAFGTTAQDLSQQTGGGGGG